MNSFHDPVFGRTSCCCLVLRVFRLPPYGLKLTVVLPSLSGPRLVNVTNASETSTLTMDPAVRASSSGFTQNAAPRTADSDASKVLSRGSGLSKAFVGQRSSFTVDCSKAGKMTWRRYDVLSVVREIRRSGSKLMVYCHLPSSSQVRTCSWWASMVLRSPVRRSWSNTWATCSIT